MRTERLELRAVRDEDIDRILEYRNLPDVTRWLLRTEVDPVSFRAAWRRAAEDPADHSKAVEAALSRGINRQLTGTSARRPRRPVVTVGSERIGMAVHPTDDGRS